MGHRVPAMRRPAPYVARLSHQCCPNCGAPATRNILHCEYCRTEFDDSTKGIDLYALCDYDPEYPPMQDETYRK